MFYLSHTLQHTPSLSLTHSLLHLSLAHGLTPLLSYSNFPSLLLPLTPHTLHLPLARSPFPSHLKCTLSF